jgi:Outer membrane protein beta-barrel domain
MKPGLAVAVVFVGFCGPAFADPEGPYVYGSVGSALAHVDKSSVDSQVSASQGGATITSSATDDPITYKLNVGYQLTHGIGFELGYGSTSSFTYSTSEPVSAKASEKLQFWDLALAANRALGAGFSIVFRGGVSYVSVSSSGSITDFRGGATEGYGGLGLKYAFGGNLSARIDWDVFQGPGGAKIGQVNFVGAGIGYNF